MPVTKINITSIVLILCMFLNSTQCYAEGTIFRSNEYSYSLMLPSGWIQIPASEIARVKAERMPEQAQHFIFDSAFQRSSSTAWFDWPYIIIQVIPPKRSGFKRLPTKAEFRQTVEALSGRKLQSRIKDVTTTIENSETKQFLESYADSLSSISVQVDFKQRKYWYVTEAMDPVLGLVNDLSAGFFLADGNLIQINCYSLGAQFNENRKDFLAIIDSFQSFAVVPQTSSLTQTKDTEFLDHFDLSKLARDAILGALLALLFGGGVWFKARRKRNDK